MIITEIKNYQKVRYTEKREKERKREREKKVRGTNRGKYNATRLHSNVNDLDFLESYKERERKKELSC